MNLFCHSSIFFTTILLQSKISEEMAVEAHLLISYVHEYFDSKL